MPITAYIEGGMSISWLPMRNPLDSSQPTNMTQAQMTGTYGRLQLPFGKRGGVMASTKGPLDSRKYTKMTQVLMTVGMANFIPVHVSNLSSGDLPNSTTCKGPGNLHVRM